MTSGHIEELALPFDAATAQGRVARRRRRMRSRMISLGVTIAILVAVYFWQRNAMSLRSFLTVYAVVLGISVVWLLVYVVGYLRARWALAAIGTGLALRIGRAGVVLAGVFVPWDEVVSLSAARGRLGGGPLLQLTRTSGGPLTVPFEQLPSRPATLDMTARAYSAGRHGIDLAAFDN